jgi:hypothetical protein
MLVYKFCCIQLKNAYSQHILIHPIHKCLFRSCSDTCKVQVLYTSCSVMSKIQLLYTTCSATSRVQMVVQKSFCLIQGADTVLMLVCYKKYDCCTQADFLRPRYSCCTQFDSLYPRYWCCTQVDFLQPSCWCCTQVGLLYPLINGSSQKPIAHNTNPPISSTNPTRKYLFARCLHLVDTPFHYLFYLLKGFPLYPAHKCCLTIALLEWRLFKFFLHTT